MLKEVIVGSLILGGCIMLGTVIGNIASDVAKTANTKSVKAIAAPKNKAVTRKKSAKAA